MRCTYAEYTKICVLTSTLKYNRSRAPASRSSRGGVARTTRTRGANHRPRPSALRGWEPLPVGRPHPEVSEAMVAGTGVGVFVTATRLPRLFGAGRAPIVSMGLGHSIKSGPWAATCRRRHCWRPTHQVRLGDWTGPDRLWLASPASQICLLR